MSKKNLQKTFDTIVFCHSRLDRESSSTKVRLKNTGEIPSDKVIYAYLSGRISLRIELIPSIVEILNITEQELFDDSELKHLKLLHHILKNPSEAERQTALLLLREEGTSKHLFPEDFQMRRIQELISYAPLRSVEKIITILERYKTAFEEFEKEKFQSIKILKIHIAEVPLSRKPH